MKILSVHAVVCIGLWASFPAVAGSQEAPVVRPGDSHLDGSRLEAFEAEYEQMGARFLTRLVLTEGARPIWSFRMITEGPQGVGIDHVGHYADDLGFAYRRFGFRGFRPEYIEVTAEDDGLTIRRMARDDGSGSFDPARIPTSGPVFDGTFVYWLLGLLPHQEDTSWRFATWSVTADAAETRTSSPVSIGTPAGFTLADGTRYEAWPVVSQAQQGEFRTWVTDRPPYLIRQEMVGPDGEVTTVVDLQRVR